MEQVNKGEKMMLAVVIILLSLQFILLVLYFIFRNQFWMLEDVTNMFTRNGIGFLVRCFVFFFLLRGHAWALLSCV